MWAAPVSQIFLHYLYDKEILEESVILQWFSRKSTGVDDSGLEPQRKHLRQQVRQRLCECISEFRVFSFVINALMRICCANH